MRILRGSIKGHTYSQRLVSSLACMFATGVMAQSDPPPNDHFVDAAPITGTSIVVTGTTMNATGEVDEPLPAENSVARTVWWRWIAPETGQLTANAHNWGIGAYQGVSIGELTPLRQSEGWVFLHVEKGREYYLQLAERPGYSGYDFTFSISFEIYPITDNDMFADAKRTWGVGASLRNASGSFAQASFEPNEPDSHTVGNDKSLWWIWQAPQSISYHFQNSFNSSARDLTFTLYRGTTLADLVKVGQGKDGCLVNVIAGQEYYLAITTPTGVFGRVNFETFNSGPLPVSQPIPGNLVRNGRFEAFPEPRSEWTTSGVLNLSTPAEGFYSVELSSGDIWQYVDTVPGRWYRLSYAVYGDIFGTPMGIQVLINGEELGRTENDPAFWIWDHFEFQATSESTRVELRSLANRNRVDAISLTWLNAPPKIVAHPRSQSIFAGDEAVFQVSVSGAPQLQFQWYRDGELLPGANQRILVLDGVTTEQAGVYHVEISNDFGTVVSHTAELAVEGIDNLQILLQPENRLALEGSSLTLSVVARGSDEISYRWFHDEMEISGETNRFLRIDDLTVVHQGNYHVIVSDQTDTVKSLTSVLTVNPVTESRGWVMFSSLFPGGNVNARVLDVDGSTPLRGDDYLVQLYAGPTVTELQPVSFPVPFSDDSPGQFHGPEVSIPAAGSQATTQLQVRAWKAVDGVSYEEARARGGRFGASPIFQISIYPTPPDQPPVIPQPLVGFQTFSLQSGRPFFNTGKIEFNRWLHSGTPEWRLIGEPGFKYVIEVRETGNFWHAVLLLDNPSGTVLFTDDEPGQLEVKFYRSRILD